MRLARKALIRRTRHIACSAAVAASLGYRCQAVGNPYDDRTFKTDPTLPRDRELVFVGRLVQEKGPDVLLEALGILAKGGLKPCLTIVGDGPMRARLIASSQDLGLARQVEFVGPVVGRSLASQLNRHQVLVVPSRWNEPFGIVALEGIACGCVVVGSSGGGLPEAIGPCGVVFPNGDTAALASALQSLLPDSGKRRRLRDGAEAHLRPHQADTVARRYLEIISGSNHTTGNRRAQQ
jgi:glycosyltransferase involved in cell wall biosynthesis